MKKQKFKFIICWTQYSRKNWYFIPFQIGWMDEKCFTQFHITIIGFSFCWQTTKPFNSNGL